FDQVLDESEAAPGSIDVLAEFGIERDGSLQQDRCDGLLLEEAGAEERFIGGRQIVPVLTKRGVDSIDVATALGANRRLHCFSTTCRFSLFRDIPVHSVIEITPR